MSEITIAQSQGALIIVPTSINTKYCPTAALWQEKQPAKSTPPIGANLATTPAPRNATTKRDHNTPKGGTPKEPSQQPKKSRQGPGVEKPAFVKSEMGMFYLKNPAMKLESVFPKELDVKLCADYTCKDHKCNAENCAFTHPHQPRDIEKLDIEKLLISSNTTSMVI